MPVAVAIPPNVLCWSKNYMQYVLQYSGMVAGSRLQIEFVDPNNSYKTLAQIEYPLLSSSGIMYIKDIDRIADNFVGYDMPTKLSSGVSNQVEETAQNLTFSIRWRTWNAGSVSAWTYDNANFITIAKGGIGHMMATEELYINYDAGVTAFDAAKFYPPNGRFCTYVPSGRSMAPNEYGWLLYVTEIGATISGPLQTVKYVVYYQDGTNNSYTRTIPVGGNPDYFGRSWYVPMGIEQAGLDPSNKGVLWYDISIQQATSPLPTTLASYRIFADYRPRYNKALLYYRNSMGGIDHIALDGTMEWMSGTVEKKEYSQHRVNPVTNYDGENPFFESNMRLQFKGTTGFINKQHKAALADLHNTTGAWLLLGGKWLNMRVPAQKMEAVSSEDMLHSYKLEFESANTYRTLPIQLTALI